MKAAAVKGHDDIAVRLSSMGASLTVTDRYGRTAVQNAHSDELRKRLIAAVGLPMEFMCLHVYYVYTYVYLPAAHASVCV